jgi:hypothetical protein
VEGAFYKVMPSPDARELVSDRYADIKELKFRTLDVYQISKERIRTA